MNKPKDSLEWHALQHNAKEAVHETIAALTRQLFHEKKGTTPDAKFIDELQEEIAGLFCELQPANFIDPEKMEALILRCNARIRNLEKPEQ